MSTDILDRLLENISVIANDPTAPLDQRLFDEAELVLAERVQADQKTSLVAALSSLLPSLQQDPTPVVNLLLRLIRDFTFGDILNLGNIPFTEGLAVGEHMVSFNRLILALLDKAALNAADAASVAGMLDTILALVRLWLCTSDTGVASQASQLLLNLLKVDQEIKTDPDAHLPSGGQGLIWKRIFGDRDIYRTFFETCSLTGPSSLKLSKSQSTIAQARLMEWLPKVGCMDWNAISRSHHPDVESDYKVSGGLLDFAAVIMVDIGDDVLMYRCLIDFFADILRSTRPSLRLPGTANDSAGLQYLMAQGLHARTAVIYTQTPGLKLDPLESMFLYGPAGNYVATYASIYPEQFLASEMPKQVMNRLQAAFDLSPAKWAHAESPKHDLHVLASLPRRALLATAGTTGWQSSPMSLLPSKATNPDVLNCLAAVFHGPEREIVLGQSSSITQEEPSEIQEANDARALYYHYLASNPQFWNDIVTHADTVALKDLALAAISCLRAVITAQWSEASTSSLPTTIATPSAGYLAILAPPALEYVLPYLLKPPRTFANLVGGRGDAESSAYKIAAAKFDTLRALYGRLVVEVERSPGEGYEEILATINKRLAEGPLSREGEVGGRIGTLEL